MNFHVLVLLFLSLLSTMQHIAKAMDVSFIPSDPDGPLPLSSSYRESLRKLCDIMDKKKTIPPELEAKKAVMKKLCVRLRKDDDNITAGTKRGLSTQVLLLLVGLGGGYWIYQNKETFLQKLRQVIGGIFPQLADLLRFRGRNSGTNRVGNGHSSGSCSSSSSYNGVADAGALREARMKRFAVLDDNGNVIPSSDGGNDSENGVISSNNDISSFDEAEPVLPSLDLNSKED